MINFEPTVMRRLKAPSRNRTLVLNHDGRDLAAAWQTILEVGDDEALAACLDDAFPGARVEIRKVQGSFELLFRQPGLLRPSRLPNYLTARSDTCSGLPRSYRPEPQG